MAEGRSEVTSTGSKASNSDICDASTDVQSECGTLEVTGCSTSKNIQPERSMQKIGNSRKRSRRHSTSTVTTKHGQDKDNIVKSTLKSSPSALYIGAIKGKSKFPDDINESDLEGHFSKYKKYILEAIIVRHLNGIPKGYGFVTFSSHEIAETVRKAYDRTVIRGCLIRVRPKTEYQSTKMTSLLSASGQLFQRGGSGNSSQKTVPQCTQDWESKMAAVDSKQKDSCHTLLVEGLHSQFSDSISDEALTEHFSGFKDDVITAYIVQDSKMQRHGIVTFRNAQAAIKAQKKYNGTHLCKTCQIRVTNVKPITPNPGPVHSKNVTISKSSCSIETVDSSPDIGSTTRSTLVTSSEQKMLKPELDVHVCDTTDSVASGQGVSGRLNAAGTADIVIENLSPLIEEDELKALILDYGAKVSSFYIYPDPTAPDEAYIADVYLTDRSQVATIISNLDKKMLLGRKPRVYSPKFSKKGHMEQSRVTAQRRISPRLYRFISYYNHTQVEQFKVNGGIFDYDDGRSSAILSSPDERSITRFLGEVVDKCTERRVDFKRSAWTFLTAREDELKPNLLDQAKTSYSVEAESDVYIVPQMDQRAVIFVGTNEGVEKAHNWLFSQIYGEVKLENERMEALVTIYPSLDAELSEKFHIKLLSYSPVSTVITIEGDGTSVHKAHQEIETIVSKFCTREVQFDHSPLLLESARKRIQENELKVSVKAINQTAADKQSPICLKVTSFLPRQLEKATEILTGIPTYKSFRISGDVIVDKSNLKSVLATVSKEYQVSIRPIYKNKLCTSLLVCGFVKSDVSAAHTKLNEKHSSFLRFEQPKVVSHAEKKRPSMVTSRESTLAVKPSSVLSKEDEIFIGTGEHCMKIRREFYTDSTCRAFVFPHAEITYFMQKNKSEWFLNLTKHCTSVEVPVRVSLSSNECTSSIQSYMVEGPVVVVNKVIKEIESLAKVFCVQADKIFLPTGRVRLIQHKWIEFTKKCEAMHNVCIDIAISSCEGPPVSTNKQDEESMSRITYTVCGSSREEVTKVKGELQMMLELGYRNSLPSNKSATSPSAATVSTKDLHSENTQCAMLLKPHYIPLFLTKKRLVICSTIEKTHGVQIVHVSPHALNSVVKQVIFKTNSDHLITVQLCYCNLLYEDVDAIVNCSRQLSVEMKNIGGPTLQLELDRYIASEQLSAATSVSTVLGSGNLHCKRVIHAISCLNGLEHGTEDLSKFSVITEALQCAQTHKLRTISFPSCSTDALYAEEMLHDIQDFLVQNPNSSLHMLRIVCSSGDLINAYCGIREFNCKEDIVDISNFETKPSSVRSMKQQWYWEADDGKFVKYSKNLSERLSVEYKISPKGICYFQVNSNLYIANFERMEQINRTTHFVRRMKVECENKKPLSTEGNESIVVGVKWFYSSDNQETTPYSAADSNTIEQHYLSSSKLATLTQGSRRFKMDFLTMTQRVLHPSLPSETNSIMLRIERKVCVYYKKTDSLSAPKWYYMGDARMFVPYSNHESVSIERMYQSKTVSTLSIQSRVYTFDFSEMKQINTETAYKRNIKRELTTTKDEYNAIEAVPQHHICRGIVVAINGSKDNVRIAKAELDSLLTSQLSTHELPLPSSVSNSLQSQRRIMSVVKKYNIMSSQITSAGSDEAESGALKLTGENTLIKIAIKAIMEEIALIGSGNQGNTASSLEIPPEWQPQRKNTELFELSKLGDEFIHIQSMFQLTMPAAVILSIKRIQNNWLWERYVITRRRIGKKNNGKVNEKELFHGSRSSRASMIYNSEEGFDMRYSSQGMWGQANYFAEKASYSNSYAYELGDGTREILLAKVLTGDSYKCQSDKTLRMPPVKGGLDTHFQQERYDTVEGETNGSKVYMTYSNDKAYPAYLIVYTPEPTVYGGHSLHRKVTAQASTSSPSWSYNLSPNPSSSAQSKTTSYHTSTAAGGTSPSATPSSQKYTPRPRYPQSTSYQTPPPNNRPSSDQKTCILQ